MESIGTTIAPHPLAYSDPTVFLIHLQKSSGWITTPNTLPRVAATIPGVAIIFVALGYVINLTRAYHPRWSRNFIREFPSPSGKKSANSQRHLSRWVIGLLLLSLIGLGLQITSSFLELRSLEYISSPLSWAISCLIIIVTRIRTASIPLLVLFVSLFISNLGAIIYTNSPLRYTTIPVALSAVLALFGVLAVLCMPLRDPALQDDSIAPVYDSPGSDLSSPEDNLTPWQYMSVSWMAPLISLGTKRQLQGDDVWDLPYEFKHRRLHDKFRDLDGSVLKRLLVANALDLLITTALGIVEMIANLSGPVLLQLLLQAMEDTGSSKKLALTWATISLLVRLVACQSAVFSTWYSRRSYERSRGEMITMLYEKTLNRKIFAGRKRDPTRSDNNEETEDGQGESDGPGNPFTRTWKQLQLYLSKCCKARKKEKPRDESEDFASMGKILNLMRNDVYEVSQRFWEFQNLITQPLSLILSIILIWRLIGWSCLLGMVIVLASQAANALTARALTRWERVRRSATDSKLQKISQFVMAIRHLRWYGWQESWLSNIMDARQHELNLRIVTGLLNVLVGFTTMLSSNLFPVLAFFAYTALAGRPLRIDVAFPAIDLFQMLSINLRLLPGLITTLVNASVALGRIQRFMREPDRPHEEHLGDEVSTLQLNKASFAWPGVDAEVLHDVTLSFPRGLTVVYGEVASGKTALLQALLGELDRRSGELLSPPEMIGYCAQTPWLESMSIRENILFFAAYDHARYRQVLEDCALVADMANFSHGDLSNIGENGIGLSGGQKARVALARAVYSRAKILILDDPFSALDHQTAETIVRRCFGRPLMEDRTIILATHRTELFQGLSKQWVEVADGKARVVESDYTALHSLPKTTSAASGDHDAEMQAEEETAEIPERFIEDEHRAHGDVQARVYWEYIKSGQLKWWGVSISFLAFYKLLDVAQAWFIKQWGEAYDSSDAQTISGPFDRFPAPDVNLKPWLLGFLLLAIAMSVAYLIDQLMHLVIIYSAGKRMFRDVMYHVSGATFRFYDVTPVGRLMNRLTSDINTIDGNISILFQLVAFYSITWISSIIVFASATPVFLIFALALTAAFVLIFLRFLPTSQSLRRLEMVSLSPLMSNFGALVEGLTTVRAFRVQYQFQERVIAVTDTFQKMDHFYWSLQAWLTYRFDALSACSTFALTMLALFTRVSPGLTAFVLVAASRFVTATHGLCRYYGQLQMDFVSVERVVEMLHLEQEPKGDVQPPAWWPSLSGDIVFEDVTMRYAPHMDPALSQLSLRIPGGSNTAVIGRTGSGKSTLALSLLGTIIPDMGRILIDNQDISTIDRQTLRKRITFLAQEPVLFEGTMRQNLDPLSEYSDFECTDAIRKVADRHNWTLTTPVDAGGRSFSQGQRQLVGLARALLRRSAIVILDEATASIDRETAMQIQRVLREDMNGSTVITIAHRLEAVEKADYCVVLGKGKLVKMGTPESMKEESLNDLLR